MLYLILGLLLFTIQNICTMEQSQNDPQVAQLVTEINARKKAKHEAIASLIYHAPFAQQVTEKQFKQLRKVCKPDHALVLRQMLTGSKPVLNPNTFYVASGISAPLTNRVSLLFEVMRYALDSNKKPEETRFEAVQLVLQAGVDLNQNGISYTDAQNSYRSATDISPLMYAWQNPFLVSLLLEKMGKPKAYDLIDLASSYEDIGKDLEKKLYRSIQLVLQTGIDVTQPCKWGGFLTSPLEYVKEKKITKLVELFEAHAKK